jgi:hypothetical protein
MCEYYNCYGFVILISIYIFRLFAQIRKEINSKKVVPLTITNAMSNHAIRQASLKEIYTSTINGKPK